MLAEHFGIEESLYKKMTGIVPVKTQMMNMKHFTVDGGMHSPEFGLVNLLYYIDRHGGKFVESKIGVPHHRIANAMYESLTSKDKIFVLQYIEGHESGWKDED